MKHLIKRIPTRNYKRKQCAAFSRDKCPTSDKTAKITILPNSRTAKWDMAASTQYCHWVWPFVRSSSRFILHGTFCTTKYYFINVVHLEGDKLKLHEAFLPTFCWKVTPILRPIIYCGISQIIRVVMNIHQPYKCLLLPLC